MNTKSIHMALECFKSSHQLVGCIDLGREIRVLFPQVVQFNIECLNLVSEPCDFGDQRFLFRVIWKWSRAD